MSPHPALAVLAVLAAAAWEPEVPAPPEPFALWRLLFQGSGTCGSGRRSTATCSRHAHAMRMQCPCSAYALGSRRQACMRYTRKVHAHAHAHGAHAHANTARPRQISSHNPAAHRRKPSPQHRLHRYCPPPTSPTLPSPPPQRPPERSPDQPLSIRAPPHRLPWMPRRPAPRRVPSPRVCPTMRRNSAPPRQH